MKKHKHTNQLLAVILILLLSGCGAKRRMTVPNLESNCGCGPVKTDKILTIKWQRLLADGKTCPRCGSTEEELEKAANLLGQALETMGIRVALEKDSLSMTEFEKDPLRSNRIWINGLPLEDYVAGKAGQSPCCDACGPNDCRTVEVDGQSYETIPSEMIVQAGLIAASRMLTPVDEKKPCCGN